MKTIIWISLAGCLIVVGLTAAPTDSQAPEKDNRLIGVITHQEMCKSNRFKSLPIMREKQDATTSSSWCGVATARIVMDYIFYGGFTPKQCELAEALAKLEPGEPTDRDPDCCNSGSHWFRCVRNRWPEKILDRYRFGYLPAPFTEQRTELVPISWDEATEEICEDRPYISSITPTGGNKHSIVTHGFWGRIALVEGHDGTRTPVFQREVQIYDPMYDDSRWDKERFSANGPPLTYSHQGDTYHIYKIIQRFPAIFERPKPIPPKRLPEQFPPSPVPPPGPFPFDSATPEAAVQQELGILRQLGLEEINKEADEAYAKSLGFDSAKEARQVEMGSPLPVYGVPEERLKAFNKGTDVDGLLVDTRSLMYPLLVNMQVRSSLTVAASETGKWSPASKGSAQFVRLLQKYRRRDSNKVILVSSVGLRFLGEGAGDKLMLIPLSNQPRLDLKAGQGPIHAREVFKKLATEANILNPPAPERGLLKRNSPKQ